jgi:hypothetical protein
LYTKKIKSTTSNKENIEFLDQKIQMNQENNASCTNLNGMQQQPTAKPKSVEQRLILINNNKDFVRVNISDASESSKSLKLGGSAKLMQTNSFDADEDDTELGTDPTNEYK